MHMLAQSFPFTGSNKFTLARNTYTFLDKSHFPILAGGTDVVICVLLDKLPAPFHDLVPLGQLQEDHPGGIPVVQLASLLHSPTFQQLSQL